MQKFNHNPMLLSVLLLLVAILLIAAVSTPQGYSLQGIDIFKTDPFPCGEEHKLQWTNNLGDIRIYQSQVWMGMFMGHVADLSFQVNVSGGSLLHRGNWDHYTDPTGITDQTQLMNWTPNYIFLKKGDTLEFVYGCYTSPIKIGVADIVVTIWYSK